jgi:acyl carrier protein
LAGQDHHNAAEPVKNAWLLCVGAELLRLPPCSHPWPRLKTAGTGDTNLSREAVLRRLEPIFRSVIDPNLTLTEELDASKVPLWDSLKHIILVVEIEMQLGVALTTDELANLQNVSELVTLLQERGVRA